MADEEKQDPVEGSTEGAGKKKKLLLIGAIVAIIVVLAAGAGVAYYLMMDDSEAPVDGEVAEEAEVLEATPLERPIYHELRPEFIITFDANNRQRYMQVQVTVVTRDPATVEGLVKHDPLIRNSLIMVFSAQDYLQLQTSEGKAKLRLEATEKIQELLLVETGSEGIETVLFTNLVLQ
jgi:flagellar FliL protein